MRDPSGKMGFGVLRYSQNPITCVVDSQSAGEDAGEVTGVPRKVPIVSTLIEARALGAEVLVLGIAPPGGLIPAEWYPVIDESVSLGFSLINGLHDLLGPRFPALPTGQWIWDVRIEPPRLGVATGAAAALAAKRVLMIGTDMAIGKMTAGLEVHAEALRRGIRSEFVATGQIGITVTGAGVPLDAVRVDFAGGSIEREVLKYRDADLIIIEGQGALIHPGSTANLPLLRGSCPSHLILCHRAGQESLIRVPGVKIPDLSKYWTLYEDLGEACGTFPRPKTCAIALNTRHLNDADAEAACRELERQTGLPTCDPVRHGAGLLLSAVLA